MDTQKKDEKNIVLELKRQLGRMMVQVDYMYRNDREMSRLDVDVMMEHTRDIYDLLCDYQAGKESFDEVEMPEDEGFKAEINEGGEIINRDVELEIETPEEKTEEMAEDSNDSVDEEFEDEDWEDEEDETFRVEPVQENVPETVEEEPQAVEEPKFVKEEPRFVDEEPEDNSLAARLQRTHVSDIRAALGINDKMMIINELFNGSFERYNKSIEALNEFPTLSGAKVYMSELQIELQWDVESQAFRMLNDLVERRFV